MWGALITQEGHVMQPGLALNNILLIGFMGSGKSSIGRRLAAFQRRRFVDTDKEVVDICGSAICTLFSLRGEEEFRSWESGVLHRLSSQQGMVLSTGGGIVLLEENRVLLRRMGIVVWLDAAADVLFERAMRSQERPLLQGKNPREKFNSLLDARRNLYRGLADLYVDSSRLSHEGAALKIVEGITGWKHKNPCHIPLTFSGGGGYTPLDLQGKLHTRSKIK
ncbi:shikimate kinase [Candidatus Xiphinematobacter sp. Idaho Grape]|uniref:shikimate kinase n=1 Tax=Candidatus Xiphinematobacter sp. Idaho Grape TaxID=1704307 RepID=UPI00130EB4A5|nr:shikimate kinase [Candidatus Xiphinematobacter sp. Idaho Grape]